jgi:hypothetical protein
MLNLDAQYKIMLNMDINTLNNFYITSKANVCNDNFWYIKFKHDNKIIHLIYF